VTTSSRNAKIGFDHAFMPKLKAQGKWHLFLCVRAIAVKEGVTGDIIQHSTHFRYQFGLLILSAHLHLSQALEEP
jgi:hypothetical protein